MLQIPVDARSHSDGIGTVDGNSGAVTRERELLGVAASDGTHKLGRISIVREYAAQKVVDGIGKKSTHEHERQKKEGLDSFHKLSLYNVRVSMTIST
jgi:hypothetical protein